MNDKALSWQHSLRDAIRDPAILAQQLHLPPDSWPAILAKNCTPHFGLLVPQPYVARMQRGNLADPLLLQVFPQQAEAQMQAGFSTNPVGDLEKQINPMLLHKYAHRVLLLLHPRCAVHCRYCFRQHYPYQNVKSGLMAESLTYIQQHSEINEVIFSGGDPLMLADERLASWLAAIEAIGHVKRLRLHSRLPVVIPARVTPQLLQLCQQSRLQIIMVLHFNHANEIDAAVADSLRQLRQAGVWLLNQTVLLHKVNDDVPALVRLSEVLAENQVLPYYLHALDAVQGASHFAVADGTAQQIMHGLRSQLPGYLVPKWVREMAGMAYKQPLI